jgi:methyl-accepting chemotaxis protein
MSGFLHNVGGMRGLSIRVRLTVAYSATSTLAMLMLGFMLVPVIELPDAFVVTALKTLFWLLLLDFIGQSIYNERAMASIIRFFKSRAIGGEVDPGLVREATADYLALPRRVAFSCLLFWIATVSSFCFVLWWNFDIHWLKLGYIFATTGVAALIAFIFQYSLFRRVIAPVGAMLVRYGGGVESLRSSGGFRVGVRARLMVTFMTLVLGALALSGMMSYGQFVRITGEQAGAMAAASLHNIAEALPADDAELPAFLKAWEKYENYSLAVWNPATGTLVGDVPIAAERLKTLVGKTTGTVEDVTSLAQVTYRAVGGRVLVAVVTPQEYLGESLVIVWVTGIIFVFTFLFSLFLFNLVTRDIVAPFSRLRSFTGSLAAGTLGETPVVVTDDEFGRLGTALRRMADGLRVMFLDIKRALENVKETRKAIGANLREVQARSQEQDHNVDRSFMSFSEVNQALRHITDNVVVVEKAARESKDATHDMSRYLDDIRSELAELVDTVRGGSRFIYTMIENVEQSGFGVNHLRDGVERLRDQIAAVHTAFDALSSEVGTVVANSGRAATLSSAGIESTEATVTGVSGAREATEALLVELGRFREGVLRIGGVVAIIADVTEQTALLAFNAAILAAQSQDEHAKDFAVVGDEIKDLAERTEASTKDVGVRMKTIQRQADRSLDELREALGLIRQGQLLTQLASDSVRLIGDQSSRNDRDVRSIGEGIYYQNHNLIEIIKSVDEELQRVVNVRNFTEDNARDAAALRAALEQLLGLIREVQTRAGQQGDGARNIAQITDQIANGITQMRRDLRKLSGASGEVVQLMNDVRFSSRRNAEQTEELNAHLKRLDQLLRGVEGKLSNLTIA